MKHMCRKMLTVNKDDVNDMDDVIINVLKIVGSSPTYKKCKIIDTLIRFWGVDRQRDSEIGVKGRLVKLIRDRCSNYYYILKSYIV